MKLFVLCALFVVGCAAAPDRGDGVATDSALSATDEDRICFSPVDHPFNGNGEVWQIDGISLLHTQTFYWHGMPMREVLGENAPPPTVYPLLENTDVRIVAGPANDPITIDITSKVLGGVTYLSGTLHQSGHDDVVLPRVGTCR